MTFNFKEINQDLEHSLINDQDPRKIWIIKCAKNYRITHNAFGSCVGFSKLASKYGFIFYKNFIVTYA